MTLQIKATSNMLWRNNKPSIKPTTKDYQLSSAEADFLHTLQQLFPQVDPLQIHTWNVPSAIFLNSYSRQLGNHYLRNVERSAQEFIEGYNRYLRDITGGDSNQFVVSTTEELVASGVDLDYSDGESIFAFANVDIKCNMINLARMCLVVVLGVDSIELVR